MSDIEIVKRVGFWPRFFEILPGFTSWTLLAMPIVLSLINPILAAFYVVGFNMIWLSKAAGMNMRVVRGYRRLRMNNSLDWQERLLDLKDLDKGIQRVETRLKRMREKNKRKNLKNYIAQLRDLKTKKFMDPDDIYHGVIIAVYNETLDIVEPTVRSVIDGHYPTKRIILNIAYEGRTGERVEKDVHYLVEKYKHHFKHMEAVKHDVLEGEVFGKGGNITKCGREMLRYVESQKLDPAQVIVTTLDSDNRPSSNYFSYLAFVYATTPDRKHYSYQPVPMFFNNIWDAPAPSRVIASGNSFWMLIQSMRPHLLRNFSAHAQPLDALIETDFWSTKTIVEDGHQFWRSYFTFDGNYRVIPIYTEIFQDAVLADGYWRTIKAQFYQLRRWAWGASDLAYVAHQWKLNPQIPWSKKLAKFMRLYEGHFSWPISPLIIAFAGWAPLVLSREYSNDVLVYNLPIIISYIQTVATLGIIVTMSLSFLSLPPRPNRYKRSRHFFMLIQWVLLPPTSILFGSMAALNAQTRLMFKLYVEKFDVTEKAVKS